jgi:hypothetical protein
MKFNLWRFDPSVKNTTGGWVLVGEVHGVSEAHALSMAAIQLKIKKMWLRAYPHIDSMPEVKAEKIS